MVQAWSQAAITLLRVASTSWKKLIIIGQLHVNDPWFELVGLAAEGIPFSCRFRSGVWRHVALPVRIALDQCVMSRRSANGHSNAFLLGTLSRSKTV